MNILLRSLLLTGISIIVISFTKDTQSEYFLPLQAQSVCTGDLDRDGFNDIVVGHNFDYISNWGGVSILYNQGWGYFTTPDSVFSLANEWASATVQLDADPHPEILFLRENSLTQNEYIVIVFNNNLHDTILLNDNRPGYAIDHLTSGDIDDNGFQDIVFACNQGHFWGIFYNFGNRIFSAPEIHSVTTYYPSGLAVGDLNNDGRDDIVLCGQLIDVYFSGQSGFTNLQLNAGGFAGDVSVSDFDLDGFKDILVNSGSGNTVLIMYKNNGNNTFQQMPDFTFQQACGQFFVTDFNNDSYPDVIYLKNDFTGYLLWHNLGGFQLGDSLSISIPDYLEPSRNFTCADLDNNAFCDIITIRFLTNSLHPNLDIRFNDGQGHFTPNPVVGLGGGSGTVATALQNFPNPFCEETTFHFILEKPAKAELSVFDLQGKQITCLVNQWLTEGSYHIPWRIPGKETSFCKPGEYLARLKIDGRPGRVLKIIRTE